MSRTAKRFVPRCESLDARIAPAIVASIPNPGTLFVGGDGGWRPWFLLVWGVTLVSGLDNVLRPWLLSRAGASVHPLLLFFAVLSGIGLFGVSGIVFGPLLIAFLLTVVHIYREHVAPEIAGARDRS